MISKIVVPFDPSAQIDPNRLLAKGRLWLLKAYLNDLRECFAGDVNRFGRMVDGKSQSLGSESGWKDKVKALLSDPLIAKYVPVELSQCREVAESLKIVKKPTECPYCHSTDISCHLGNWSCPDCGREGSY